MHAFKKSLPDMLTLSDALYHHFYQRWTTAMGMIKGQALPFSVEHFSERIPARQTNNMLDLFELIIEAMLHAIRQQPAEEFTTGIWLQFLTVLLQDLTQLTMEQITRFSHNFRFTTGDYEKATEAAKVIVNDFESYHTVEQLARKVGTTEMKLQQAFQYQFQMTVAQFSRQARMQEGHRLLTATDFPLRVICTMVGYDDPGNFCVAFKKQYGYNPGFIQKCRKK